MTKFIVNNRTDAWATEANLLFFITNCQIVCSCSLTYIVQIINSASVSQWARENVCSFRKKANRKHKPYVYLSSVAIFNISPLVCLDETPWTVLSHRKFLSSVWHFWHFWHFLECVHFNTMVRNDVINTLKSHVWGYTDTPVRSRM